MTAIGTDLATVPGVARRLYLAIDGLEPYLWQGGEAPPAPFSLPSQQGKLRSSDYDALDYFGYSVAISGDYLIVGAYDESTSTGAAYIFLRTGSSWAQQQKLTASDAAAGDKFGWSVDIDGATCIVGAPYEHGAGDNRGAAYVFTRSGTTWTEEQKITASDTADNDLFGSAVSVAGDVAAVGSPEADTAPELSNGAAYVYTRTGVVWTEQQKIVLASHATGDKMGQRGAVALCKQTGTSLILGCKLRDTDGTDAGRAYVYTQSGGVWSLEQSLIPSDFGAQRHFGDCVSIDGNTAVVCSSPAAGATDPDPTAYVYKRVSTTWTQQQRIIIVEEAAATNAGAAAVDEAAGLIVVGAAYTDSPGPINNGYSALYYRSAGGEWRLLKAQNEYGTSMCVGTSVAIDGTTAAVGNESLDWVYVYNTTQAWTRSGIACLRCPEEEASVGAIDLGTMKQEASGLTFKLEDYRQSDGTWYFAKLFAPGRFDASTEHRCWLYPGVKATPTTWQLDANATAVACTDNSAFDSAGEAHVGQTCFTYTSKPGPVGDAYSFDGVTFGAYPAISAVTCGISYPRPLPESEQAALPISTVPYSWFNRRVALYVTTRNQDTGEWRAPGEIVWAGRISEEITWSAKEACWTLACRSILEDLETKIAADMPRVPLDWINLSGAEGMKLVFEVSHEDTIIDSIVPPLAHSEEVLDARAVIRPSAGFYMNAEGLAYEINKQLALPANWSAVSPVWFHLDMGDDGRWYFQGVNTDSHDNIVNIYVYRQITVVGGVEDAQVNSLSCTCHPLRAMGWTQEQLNDRIHFVLKESGDEDSFAWTAAEEPYDYYHPLHGYCNGWKIGLQKHLGYSPLWTDQGDYGSASAFIQIREATTTYDGEKGAYQARYTGWYQTFPIDGGTVQVDYLDLYNWYATAKPYRQCAFAGGRKIDGEVTIENVYVPHWKNSSGVVRGPFELWLYSLLSTGAANYNHATYDKLPRQLGIGIPAAIVDTASFTAIDALILAKYPELAKRECYVIDEATSFYELFLRDAALFGCFLCWDISTGKIALKSAYEHATHLWTVTLSEGSDATDEVQDEVRSSDATVVNTYELTLGWDPCYRKPTHEVTIVDGNSVAGLHQTKSVKIEHPGVRVDADAGSIRNLVAQALIAESEKAYPWWTTSCTLAAWLFRKVSTGDVVKYTSNTTPDPYGTGALSIAALGIVLDVSWNYSTWVGTAQLLLYSRYDAATKVPWAACALVDHAAANAGWDAANHRLTLTALTYGQAGDSDDGAAFSTGHFVMIQETDPTVPAVPQVWGPLAVESAYETEGAALLTLAHGTVLAGWDTAKEYVVLPADYGGCIAAQQTTNAFQAATGTHLLGGTDRAQRYG